VAHLHDFRAASLLGLSFLREEADTDRIPPSVRSPALADAFKTAGATPVGRLTVASLASRRRGLLGEVLDETREVVKELLDHVDLPLDLKLNALVGTLAHGDDQRLLGQIDATDPLQRVLYSLAHLSTEKPVHPEPGTVEVTVKTKVLSPLSSLVRWVDPRGWDDCSEFFIKTARFGEPSPPPPLGTPWQGTLLEKVGWTVDIGLAVPIGLVITNHLDIDFNADAAAARANYSLGPSGSQDGLMRINEGHFQAALFTPSSCDVEVRKKVDFEEPLLAAVAPFVLEPFLVDQVVRVLNAC
jgi:hypothetical protein